MITQSPTQPVSSHSRTFLGGWRERTSMFQRKPRNANVKRFMVSYFNVLCCKHIRDSPIETLRPKDDLRMEFLLLTVESLPSGWKTFSSSIDMASLTYSPYCVRASEEWFLDISRGLMHLPSFVKLEIYYYRPRK